MNARLTQTELKHWEQSLHTTLSREETLEMIVPDACPDIQDIVHTQAVPELRVRESMDGAVPISGRVSCAILYRAEGSGALERLHCALNVEFTAELEGVTQRSQCLLTPRVSLSETRSINPRKVLVRVVLALELSVYTPTALVWATELEDSAALGIEVRSELFSGSFVRSVVQRPFPVAETVQLPGSRAPMSELLSVRARAFETESRLVGEKLLFKGGAMVHLLYRTEEGALSTADFELPFSQIAQVGETGEGSEFQLALPITGVQAHPCPPDGRGVELELELLAQLLVRERRELRCLTDAYSLRPGAAPEFTLCPVPELLEQGTRRADARELLEAPEPLSQVCELNVTALETRLAGGELTAQLRLTALCLTQSGSCCALNRTLRLYTALNVPEQAQCQASCQITEADASVTEGGLELRVSGQFRYLVQRQQRVRCLSAFALDETAQEPEERASLVLRRLKRGESLWDAAKRARTTRAAIVQANDLTQEEPEPGRMLLIPRAR